MGVSAAVKHWILGRRYFHADSMIPPVLSAVGRLIAGYIEGWMSIVLVSCR